MTKIADGPPSVGQNSPPEETTMMTAPLTEVREKLSEIVDDVASGTEWTVTRHGRPVAVILGYDEYESLVETLNILSDPDTMGALAEAEAELTAGDTEGNIDAHMDSTR
jgi:prevent-host-death family protein